MKRYRLFSFDFDSRAEIINLDIKDNWSNEVKKLWIKNKRDIEIRYIKEYGESQWDIKLKNIKDLGAAPVSILAFHNKFLIQIRNSFVITAYYPALTGACALGERILNYLILTLREDFKGTPEYKKVYNKDSFDNWNLPIEVLEKWDVLLPDVIKDFKKLGDIRNHEAIHFAKGLENKDRETSLRAIQTLASIISGQFSSMGTQPWFIENTKGEFYLKKDSEKDPFIKKIYIPNSFLVGPCHQIDNTGKLFDTENYKNVEISDAEFVRLRERFKGSGKV